MGIPIEDIKEFIAVIQKDFDANAGHKHTAEDRHGYANSLIYQEGFVKGAIYGAQELRHFVMIRLNNMVKDND